MNETARILRSRAQLLSRKPLEATDSTALLEVLEFRLAPERYALETRHVKEVCVLRELTPLPCTPAFILGIVNVRGRLVPVLDLKRFFQLPEQGLTDLHRVILVQNRDFELGLLADVVTGIRHLAVGTLQHNLHTLTGTQERYFQAVSADRLIVLDVDKILGDPGIIVDEIVES